MYLNFCQYDWEYDPIEMVISYHVVLKEHCCYKSVGFAEQFAVYMRV